MGNAWKQWKPTFKHTKFQLNIITIAILVTYYLLTWNQHMFKVHCREESWGGRVLFVPSPHYPQFYEDWNVEDNRKLASLWRWTIVLPNQAKCSNKLLLVSISHYSPSPVDHLLFSLLLTCLQVFPASDETNMLISFSDNSDPMLPARKIPRPIKLKCKENWNLCAFSNIYCVKEWWHILL